MTGPRCRFAGGFIAQHALTSQVQQLDGRLAVKLFERTTRKVSLTETGEQPLPHAVATLDAGIRAVEAAPRAERATLRASGLSGTAMVPAAGETMRRFTQRHPDIELVVSNPGRNQPAGGAQ